jgi:hypothetical protein
MLRTCSGVQLRELRQIERSLRFSVLAEGTQLITLVYGTSLVASINLASCRMRKSNWASRFQQCTKLDG